MLLLTRNVFLATIALCFLLICVPTTVSSAAKAKTTKGANANKLASDYCKQKRTINDRKFCLKVLTSNPKLSAKDYPSLLKIALMAADNNAKKILEYLEINLKSKATKQKLKPVLKDCIAMYGIVLNEFKGILSNIEVNSSLVKLYARIANDEIRGCDNVVISNKIQEGKPISNRNKIAEMLGVLVEDIANLV